MSEKVYCHEYLSRLASVVIPGKYAEWYFRLCEKASFRCSSKAEARELLGYVESHHVLPRSFHLGGEKDPLNIVHFSAREHFIAHVLLAKISKIPYRYSMLSAFIMMSGRKKIRGTSRTYQALREASRVVGPKQRAAYDLWKQRGPTPAMLAGYNTQRGTSKTAHVDSPKFYASHAARKGRPRSAKELEGTKKRLAVLMPCPHCPAICTRVNYHRWHGDKCQYKNSPFPLVFKQGTWGGPMVHFVLACKVCQNTFERPSIQDCCSRECQSNRQRMLHLEKLK